MTVREKTVGISYPISVTFVEVQLGSGGVLCVAQGTAQSHGKEGEDQRVSAHQLHLKCCNLFLFWLGHVQSGFSKKKRSNNGFALVLKRFLQKQNMENELRHPHVWW